MMGAPYMNGGLQTEEPGSVQQPLVSIAPIRITAAQIWAAILAIPATLAMLHSYGLVYKPAKDSELVALTAIVQQLDSAQKQSSEAIRRLTEAVDNLSGLVVKIPKPKGLTGAIKLR